MRLLRTRTDGRPGVLLSAALGHGVALAASVAIVFGANACRRSPAPTQFASARSLSGTLTSTDPSVLQHDDGQWVMPAKDYAATRFSGLTDINASNVQQLAVAWTFSTGMVAGHEAAPLVVGDTMYIVTPFPNTLYAFDLSRPGAPMRWRYDPKPLAAVAGCGLLRSRQSRGGVCRRAGVLQHARQPDGGGGRQHRRGEVDHPARRHQQGRDDDDGAARGEGAGAGRQQRRRVRRARLAGRAGGVVGGGALARLQHRA